MFMSAQHSQSIEGCNKWRRMTAWQHGTWLIDESIHTRRRIQVITDLPPLHQRIKSWILLDLCTSLNSIIHLHNRKYDALDWLPHVSPSSPSKHLKTAPNGTQITQIWLSWEYRYAFETWNFSHLQWSVLLPRLGWAALQFSQKKNSTTSKALKGVAIPVRL